MRHDFVQTIDMRFSEPQLYFKCIDSHCPTSDALFTASVMLKWHLPPYFSFVCSGFTFFRPSVFSRVHATLEPAMSVGWSVIWSVSPSHFAFSAFTGGFGVTAPAQKLGWSILSLPLPTRTWSFSTMTLNKILRKTRPTPLSRLRSSRLKDQKSECKMT